jgi:serine/threonine protein kinase
MFPQSNPLAVDLLEKMLQFDPRNRITVEDALKHPYLAQLHDSAAEPSAPGAPCLFLVDFRQASFALPLGHFSQQPRTCCRCSPSDRCMPQACMAAACTE